MRRKILMTILWHLPKKTAHKILYKRHMKKKLNITNPKTLNEKIHWLELNYYGIKEARLTDKIVVKDYINSLHIEKLHVPKTYKIIDKNTTIDDLPNSFVLKCNHGSGHVFICQNKDKFDYSKAIRKLKKIKRQNFAKDALEYHYSLIKPEIMCEEYLNDFNNINPPDYKFFCFNGFVECVMVCTDRGNKNYKDFYDKKWNHLDWSNSKIQSPNNIPKPKNYEKMICIASQISNGFPFVRVDLYNINGKIYFGEMTFTPAAGLSKTYTEECDNYLGNLINIEMLKNKE